MKIVNDKVFKRERRHRRVRNKIVGTSERPRLCVFKSLKHIYAQIVDDTFVNEKGECVSRTIAAASTLKLGAAGPAGGQAEPEKAEAEGKGQKGQKGQKGKKDKKVWTGGKKTAGARVVGRMIAEAAKEKGINTVAFDRGGYLYHGRVAALAEEARKAGLEF